jgi:hypothetical protein
MHLPADVGYRVKLRAITGLEKKSFLDEFFGDQRPEKTERCLAAFPLEQRPVPVRILPDADAKKIHDVCRMFILLK